MKTIPVLLASHYASGSTTLALGLRIERSDGLIFRVTGWDQDLVIEGETYLAGPGLDLSSIVYTADLAPNNLELRVLYEDGAVARDDVLAGRWDGATFDLFEFNARNPAAGVNPLLSGTTGEARITHATGLTVELRSLKQHLQRAIGQVTQKTCRYQLGDARCGVDLGPLTFADVPVTAVTSSREFTATSLTEDGTYFQGGPITFTTGLNAGITRTCKAFTVGGGIALIAPFPFEIEVGDEFTAVAGCMKRFEEDCKIKHDNALNFGGEPHLVGVDALTALPTGGGA